MWRIKSLTILTAIALIIIGTVAVLYLENEYGKYLIGIGAWIFVLREKTNIQYQKDLKLEQSKTTRSGN
jgi:hypothetical protein